MRFHFRVSDPSVVPWVPVCKRRVLAIYNSGVRWYDRFEDWGLFIVQMRINNEEVYVNLMGKGEAYFEFQTTGLPVQYWTFSQGGITGQAYNVGVVGVSISKGVATAKLLGGERVGYPGAVAVSRIKRQNQVILLDEPVHYYSTKTNPKSSQHYARMLYDAWAPLHPHTGLHFRSYHNFWQIITSHTFLGSFSSHYLRDIGYDVVWADNVEFEAWVDWWFGLSVTTAGCVGDVTVTVTDALIVTPAGKTVAVATGTLGVQTSISISLLGKQVSVSRGTILAGEAAAALSGVALVAQTGVLAPAISQTLTGTSVAAQSGLLVTALVAALTGKTVSVTPGPLAPAISFALTGAQASVQPGALGAALSITLDGKSIVMQPGTLAWRMAVALLGQSTRVDRGSLTPDIQILLGMPALGLSTGALLTRLQYTLGGYPLAVVRGTFTLRVDCNSYPNGVWTIGQVGVLPTDTNVPKPTADMLLWARAAVRELVVEDALSKDVYLDEEPME